MQYFRNSGGLRPTGDTKGRLALLRFKFFVGDLLIKMNLKEPYTFKGEAITKNNSFANIIYNYEQNMFLNQENGGLKPPDYPQADMVKIFKENYNKVRENPDDVAAHHKLGSIYLNLGMNGDVKDFTRVKALNKAMAHFNKAHRLAPGIAAYREGLSTATEEHRHLSLKGATY